MNRLDRKEGMRYLPTNWTGKVLLFQYSKYDIKTIKRFGKFRRINWTKLLGEYRSTFGYLLPADIKLPIYAPRKPNV